MNNYIDVHCHALYGIDDGSRSIDESVNIINSLKELGFSCEYQSSTNYLLIEKIKNG